MKLFKKVFYIFLLLQIVIIILFWWPLSGRLLFHSTTDFFISLGRLCGLIMVFLVLLQFLLRARISLLEKNIGYEELNTIHKKNGYVIFIFLLMHPLFLTIGYALSARISYIAQFLNFITGDGDMLQAFLGFLLFIGVIASSIYIVRNKLKYEFWYIVHLFTYLAIVLAWGHQLEMGSDFAVNQWFVYYWYSLYAITFGSLLYWRILRLLFMNYKHRFYVKKIIQETSDTFSLEIAGKQLETFQFNAGQFAMFRFFTNNVWWQSHPFSFSSLKNDKSVRITVKKLGDFTKHIDKIKKGTQIMIDGPHGSFTLHFADKKKLLFIAAGVGITPIRTLIEEASQQKKDIVLIYGNKKWDNVIFKNELKILSEKYKFPIHYIISRDRKFKGLKGRITAELIAKIVSDLNERDIFICGPVGMPVSLRKELVHAGAPSNQIHFERFAF